MPCSTPNRQFGITAASINILTKCLALQEISLSSNMHNYWRGRVVKTSTALESRPERYIGRSAQDSVKIAWSTRRSEERPRSATDCRVMRRENCLTLFPPELFIVANTHDARGLTLTRVGGSEGVAAQCTSGPMSTTSKQSMRPL